MTEDNTLDLELIELGVASEATLGIEGALDEFDDEHRPV